jgi:hypothetical protein
MRRLTGEPALTELPTTNNAAPQFPDAWMRVQRVGAEFKMFRGTNGVGWEQIGSAEFPDSSPTNVFVGVAFSPQNEDLFQSSGLRNLFVAKFRNYDLTTNSSGSITIQKLPVPGQAQLSWTSSWILQTTTSLPGTWEDTQNQANPQTITINTNEPKRFYRVRH